MTHRQLLTRRAASVVALVVLLSTLVAAALRHELSNETDGSQLTHRSDAVATSDTSSATTLPTNEETASSARFLEVATSTFSQVRPPNMEQRYTGIVLPRRTSLLAAKALGRVEEVRADIGDAVRAGDLLIELDDDQLAAELEVAQASLAAAQDRLQEMLAGPRRQDIEQAESRVNELQAILDLEQANLERTQALKASRAISIQELDERRFQVQATTARLAAAQQQLNLLREGTRAEQLAAQKNLVASLLAEVDRIQVRLDEQRILAPYDGQVQQRLVDEGAVVSPGQALLEIVETGALEIHVGLPAELAADLQAGVMEHIFVLPPGRSQPSTDLAAGRVSARLDRISPNLDATTRTRRCILLIEAKETPLIAIGDSVDVLLNHSRESANHYHGTWVPTEALTAGPRGLWMLFVTVPADQDSRFPELDLQKIEQRPVELLQAHGEWSLVRGPLDQNERFVTRGVHRIVAGQLVRLQND